jgi:hypothetical protein
MERFEETVIDAEAIVGFTLKMRSLSDRAREYRIQRRLAALEKLVHLLDDATPEEHQKFKEAIRRRPLFDTGVIP